MSQPVRPDREQAITELPSHLEAFTTPELIVASGDLRCSYPLDDQGKWRIRQALAGAFAFGRIGSYREVLRSVDAERLRIGQEIHGLRSQMRRVEESDPLAIHQMEVQAVHLSGLQEVTFHFIASSAMRIARLFPLVERATGFSMPSKDAAIFSSYKPLRDYFEHLEERVPGRSKQNEVVSEFQDDIEWRVVAGFNRDDLGRIVIDGQAIDVTSRGLAALEDVIQRSYPSVRNGALAQVQRHFQQVSAPVPRPEQVPFKALVSIDTDWDRDADGSDYEFYPNASSE